MTPVMKAEYRPDDERYPIVVVGPEWWEKMSRDEAIDLVGELMDAINEVDRNQKQKLAA